MLGDIDKYRKPQDIELWLARPDKTVIAPLPEAFNKKYTPRLGSLNELSCSLPFKVEKRMKVIDNPHIELLRDRYLIKAVNGSNVEWFRIDNIQDNAEETDRKDVHTFLLPIEIQDKTIRNVSETSKNATDMLNLALQETGWDIDYVDADFDLLYREFNISDTDRLNFLYQIATTFGGVLEFDTINRKVSLKKQDSIGQDKGLTITFEKYMKSLSRESKSDDIVSYLIPYGKDDLQINSVTPNGQNGIENLSFFIYPFQRDENKNVIQSSYYMTDSLANAILDYYDLIDSKQTEFDNLLSQRDSLNTTSTQQQDDLVQLQTDMALIQDSLDVAKASGSDTTDLEQQKVDKQSEIDAKQSEIDSTQSQLDQNQSDINTLGQTLSLENNFTPEQLAERNLFIKKQHMDFSSITDVNDLLTEAKKALENLNTPKTVVNINIVNFLSVVEAQRDWDKLNIGDTITIKYEQIGVSVKAKITEYTIDFESNNIDLTIADTINIKDDDAKFIESINKSVATASTVDLSRSKWDGYNDQLGDIYNQINADFDTVKRKILAGVNQSISISGRGLIATDPNNPDDMLILQAGVLALSNTAGQDWQTAITPYGVIADRLIGKMIIGVNLDLENESGKFSFTKDGIVVDGSAFTMTGGTNGISITPDNGLIVTRSDNHIKTLLNATDGIKIQTSTDGQIFTDVFYVDTNGNLTAENLITRKISIRDSFNNTIIDANTGTIDFSKFPNKIGVIPAGNLNVKGLTVNNGSKNTLVIDSSGNVTFAGSLSGATGTFSGELSAAKGTFAGELTGGSITSDTVINVTTDLYVGNNVYLGQAFQGNAKTITFNNGSQIYATQDYMSFYAMFLNFYADSTFNGSVYSQSNGAAYFGYDSSNYLKIYNSGGSQGAQFWINNTVKATWTSLPKVRLDPDLSQPERSFGVNNPGSMQPLLTDYRVVSGDTRIDLDKRFVDFVGDYQVFVNNGTVTNKQSTYFEVQGTGTIACFIIGIESGKENVWGYEIVTESTDQSKLPDEQKKAVGDFLESTLVIS